MNRLKPILLPGCVMLLLTSGCVSHTVPLTSQLPPSQQAVKPSSLSNYIR